MASDGQQRIAPPDILFDPVTHAYTSTTQPNTDRRKSPAHHVCQTGEVLTSIEPACNRSQHTVPKIIVHPPQPSQSPEKIPAAHPSPTKVPNRVKCESERYPAPGTNEVCPISECAGLDNLKRKGEGEYYEYLDIDGHQRRRSMLREVAEDDCLLVRGANPRTGMVSPAKLSIANASANEIAAAHAQTRVLTPKWRQQGDQWISVSDVDDIPSTVSAISSVALPNISTGGRPALSTVEVLARSSPMAINTYLSQAPQSTLQDTMDNTHQSTMDFKVPLDQPRPYDNAKVKELHSSHEHSVKRKPIKQDFGAYELSNRARIADSMPRSLTSGTRLLSASSTGYNEAQPSVSQRLPTFPLSSVQPLASLTQNKPAIPTQHNLGLVSEATSKKLTFSARNQDLRSISLDKKLPDLPMRCGPSQQRRADPVPNAKPPGTLLLSHQERLSSTQHSLQRQPERQYQAFRKITSSPHSEPVRTGTRPKQITQVGGMTEIPVYDNPPKPPSHTFRLERATESPRLPPLNLTTTPEQVHQKMAQDLFTTIPTTTSTFTTPTHFKDNINIPSLLIQNLPDTLVAPQRPSRTTHSLIPPTTVRTQPSMPRHNHRCTVKCHPTCMGKRLRSNMIGTAVNQGHKEASRQPLPVNEISVLTNFQTPAPNPYKIQQDIRQRSTTKENTTHTILESQDPTRKCSCCHHVPVPGTDCDTAGNPMTPKSRTVSTGANAPEPLSNLSLLADMTQSKAQKKRTKLPAFALNLKSSLMKPALWDQSEMKTSATEPELMAPRETCSGAIAAARRAIDLQSTPSSPEEHTLNELFVTRRRPRRLETQSKLTRSSLMPLPLKPQARGFPFIAAGDIREKLLDIDNQLDGQFAGANEIRKTTPLTGWTKVTSKRTETGYIDSFCSATPVLTRLNIPSLWNAQTVSFATTRTWLSQNPQVESVFWAILQAYWGMLLEVLFSSRRLLSFLIIYSRTGVVEFGYQTTTTQLAGDLVRNVLYALVLISVTLVLAHVLRVVLLPVWAVVWVLKIVLLVVGTVFRVLTGGKA